MSRNFLGKENQKENSRQRREGRKNIFLLENNVQISMARVLSMRQREATDANEEVCRGQMMDL